MAEEQPQNITEGATTASAEDRKAASALANLDDNNNASGDASAKNVDQEAVSKAMQKLTVGGGASASKKDTKNVKVDQADVSLLMDELDLTKVKATELLKCNEGNAVKALRAYIAA